MMTRPRPGLLFTALLLAASFSLAPAALNAAPQPVKPAPLLGSHPSPGNKNARLALTKQRSGTVQLNGVRSVKAVNSLNPRPGKTVTVGRRLPK
jgi:hypothetical protein